MTNVDNSFLDTKAKVCLEYIFYLYWLEFRIKLDTLAILHNATKSSPIQDELSLSLLRLNEFFL